MSKLNELRFGTEQRPVSQTVTTERKPPQVISGTPVHAVLESKDLIHGETWLTLVPDAPDDRRLWEFNVTSGRLVQTRKAGRQ